MAETGGQDRTERATPKRLRDARKRGELPRSRELASLIVVGAGVLTLMLLGNAIAHGAARWMQRALSPDPAILEHPDGMIAHLATLLRDGFSIALPLLVAGFAAGVIAPLVLGGWNFSLQALTPRFGRIDPLKGLGRMFSGASLVELLKTVLKAGLLGAIAAVYVYTHLDHLMVLGREATESAIAHGLGLALGALAWLGAGLLLIAAIDAPHQLWSYARRLRMTRQEVRQEYKEAEGSPEVKGRLRRLQQEVAQRRMMDAVPTADVVVVNPSHYAVALKYESGRMRAPRVVAKGVDLIALTIRELAGRHKVPIVSAPPLARALYRSTRLGDEIPANLYAAVAQVLTYIYQLRNWRSQTGPAGRPPAPPVIGDVPGGEADDAA
ncbi:flagellar biosynthetic protein FlhB [Fontimonas thermophila]|uniref:Flagellar biosynthetic protein FlhB n=1 Tax=Fontimonas thermophila TaxID=1076937 RepID=A0A1I2IQG2_9GAMM|nr:flagellar biosynthesis protein FlhB [Fontimonas thermophila]SFF43888.1 flagellar biosynthetic protein FlhB [Fontimonas thermophila]